jgi:CRP-like cAMP-binding protein
MATKERLESQEIFSFLRPEQVNLISDASETVRYSEGATVYSQGEKADHMYVVLKGEVTLWLPGKGGVSVPIEHLTPGAMFGAGMCFENDSYSTTARCTRESRLMKINAVMFRDLMDDDNRMGCAIQRRMASVYFNRYVETMRKLQSIVMNLPVEAQ